MQRGLAQPLQRPPPSPTARACSTGERLVHSAPDAATITSDQSLRSLATEQWSPTASSVSRRSSLVIGGSRSARACCSTTAMDPSDSTSTSEPRPKLAFHLGELQEEVAAFCTESVGRHREQEPGFGWRRDDRRYSQEGPWHDRERRRARASVERLLVHHSDKLRFSSHSRRVQLAGCPDARVPADKRGPTLARQPTDHPPGQLGVLLVQRLAAPAVHQPQHLRDPLPQRSRDAQASQRLSTPPVPPAGTGHRARDGRHRVGAWPTRSAAFSARTRWLGITSARASRSDGLCASTGSAEVRARVTVTKETRLRR